MKKPDDNLQRPLVPESRQPARRPCVFCGVDARPHGYIANHAVCGRHIHLLQLVWRKKHNLTRVH